MKQLENISVSPITNSNLEPFMSCEDHTVSHEKFSILKDTKANFLITSPQPRSVDIMAYYESTDYISHSDTRVNLLDKIYHLVRKFTIYSKVKRLRKEQPDGVTLLDIGCGTGSFLSACAKKNWTIYGIEPNTKANNAAKLKTKSQNIYVSISELKENHIAKQFDVITLWHVLEHIPNLNSYIREVKQLLKPKGTLIVAVPNFTSYDAKYYKIFWAAYDVPRHLWHFSPKAIALLFKKVNMSVTRTAPMIFDAFYVSLLSEKYKSKKSNFIKAFYIGLLSNYKALFTKQYSSLIYTLKNEN